jgi:sulfate adenylyltransferase subunit 1 (EFTu-like GTPase family)
VRTATKDLLRLATIGSVDDGKSTLIGRLLVDTRQLFDDQLDAVAAASEKRGVGDLDLSFVTDGLRAEREQGITIDVAYRYASTPKRKFIIADCPGHVQYTRNMATGASTADLALVVLDVAHGLQGADPSTPVHRRAARRALAHRERSTRWTASTGPRAPSRAWSTRSRRWRAN